MAKVIYWLWFRIVLPLALIGFAAHAQAAPDIPKALAWLQSQVQGDGSLQGEAASIATPMQARSESLSTLGLLASVPPALGSAIVSDNVDNTEYLSRQAIARVLSGQNADAIIATLAARQNADGGFGGDVGFESDVVDTTWVLFAFKATGFSASATLSKVLGYLGSTASADGGFSVVPGGPGDVFATSEVLLALQAYSQSFSLSAPIANAKHWLLAAQSAGSYGSTLTDAVAMLALVDVTPDATAYAGAIAALGQSQQADGSWDEDPYLTALVLRALHNAAQGPTPPAAGQIRGTVIDGGTQAGLAGAQIQIVEAPSFTATSAADGKFDLASVPPGVYSVQVGKTGYGTITFGNVSVTAGGLVDLGNITLTAASNASTVRGTISDGSNANPLGGAKIGVTVNGVLGAATSAIGGEYEIGGLAPGSAAIAVSKTGYDTVNVGGQLPAGVVVTFSPSLYPLGTTPATVSLQASVVDASGAPISGATLNLGASAATADAGGVVSLSGLSAGAYTATFGAAGYTSTTVLVVLAPGINNLGKITLAKLAAASALSGVVTDASTGKPIAGAVLMMQGASAKSVTGADGRYAFSGVSGTQVTLYVSAAGYMGRTVNATLSAPGNYVLDISLDQLAANGIAITSVTTDAHTYDPFSQVAAIATIVNTSGQDANVTVRALVIDAKGSIVKEIQVKPGLGAVNPPDIPIAIPAGGTQTVPFTWYVLSAEAGDYVLDVRASDTDGRVVAEGSASVSVDAMGRIGGGITLDPPITQVGGQPVHITAKLGNHGNLPVPVGTVQLAVTLETPDTSGSPPLQTGLKALLDGAPLNGSRGGVFDAAGNLYVVNPSERKVLKIAPDGQASVFASISTTMSPNPLRDLAFDKDGNLLVLPNYGNRYIKIAPDGTQTIVATGFSSTQSGIDVDAQGNVYVTGNPPSGGTALMRIDPAGNGTILVSNGLSTPTGAVLDASGTLYVSNYGDNTVSKVAPGGKITSFASGLNRPQGIAMDGQGNLYVANSGANNIVKIQPDGSSSVFATGLSNPYGLSFDPLGSLFVTNSANNTVSKIDSSGVVSVFAKSVASSPEGMAYDAAGNLYIANAGNNTLTKLDSADEVSVVSTGLNNPRGVTVSSTGDIYVANYSSSAIVRVSGSTTTTFATGLSGPYGLSMDAGGNLYVAEYSANRISVLDASGQRQIVAESLLNYPREIQIDGAGTQYVLNANNIVKLDGANVGSIVVRGLSSALSFVPVSGDGFWVLDGNYTLKRINALGAVASSKSIAYSSGGLALDAAGKVYITDYNNRAIVTIDATGTSSVFATLAYQPTGLVSDGSGGFLVSMTNNQIVRVSASGAVSNFTTVSSLAKIAVDSVGNVYVTVNTNTNNVKVLDTSGALVRTFTGTPYPNGIAVTSAGQILVANPSYGQRLSTYDSQGGLISSFSGFDHPKDVVWTGSQLIFSDGNNRIYSLVPGQNPQAIGAASADYLAWINGVLYLTNSGGIYTLQADGSAKAYYTASGLSSLSGLALRPDGAISFGARAGSRVMTLSAAPQVIASYAGLSSPQGVAVDTAGNVYVGNGGANSIVRILPSGRQSDVFGTGIYPRSLAFDAGGQLYGTYSGSVYKIGAGGSVTTVATGGGTAWGLAIQGGGIYATDSSGGAVRVAHGNALDIYAYGLGNAQGVRVGPDGAVYIAGLTGGVVTRYGVGGLTTYATGLSSPQALAFDAAGNLYVGGSGGALSMVDLAGQTTALSVSSLLGSKSIDGLAFDASGTLHITSASRSAVYKVAIPSPQTIPAAGTVVYTATASVPALAVGSDAVPLDFGSWLPTYGGDYSIRITPAQPTVGGTLTNGLHVGPNASGTIATDKVALTPGQNTVGLDIKLKGADFTSIAKADPTNLAATVSTQGIYPHSMPADRAGNIYLPNTNVIKQISPAGVMSDFVTLSGVSSGAPIAIDSNEALYVAVSTSLKRVAHDGSVTTLAALPSAPKSLAVDSRDNILVLGTSAVYRVAPNGATETVNSAGVANPYALTVDGHDNIYVQNQGNVITKIAPDGTTTVLLSPDAKGQPTFEYEGINVAGDCSDNVFITPMSWDKVGQSGEEHTVVQLIGRTGQAASVLNGLNVSPQMSDMDLITYDRFSSSLLIWTDAGYLTYKLPVTCGAISVDLHMVLPYGQPAAGFNTAPTATLARADGSTEYVWSLKDVTSFGQDVRFDTTLSGLALGEERAVASDAYLVFKNSFVPGDVRVPLDIPKLAVGSLVNLAVAVDKPEYPADTDTGIVVDLGNPNPTAVDGILKVDIVDANGVLVRTILAHDVAIPGAGSLSAMPSPPFNTGNTVAGTYTVNAYLSDAQGTILAQGSTTFKIVAGSGGNKQLTSTLSVDKLVYGPFDPVQIQARVTNQVSNLDFNDLTVSETVTDAVGAVVYSGSRTIPQLVGNAFRDLGFVYLLNNAPAGTYTVVQNVTDASGTILDTQTTTFDVQSSATSLSGIKGSIGAQPKEVVEGNPVTLTAQVDNLGNADLAGLPVSVTIIDPGTQQAVASWPTTTDIAQQHSYTTGANWPTHVSSSVTAANNAGKSVYLAILAATVNGKSVTLASDTFTVVPKPVVAPVLVGSITVNPKTVPIGATADIAAVAINQGNADAVGQALQIAIVDPASGVTLASWPYTATIAQGKGYAMSSAWTTSGTPGAVYHAVLSATVNGKSVTLATDSFTLGGPAGGITDIPAMAPWQTALLILIMLALGAQRARAGRKHA